MPSMATQRNSRFRVMAEGEDAAGTFLVTYLLIVPAEASLRDRLAEQADEEVHRYENRERNRDAGRELLGP